MIASIRAYPNKDDRRRRFLREREATMRPATVAVMRHGGTHLIRPLVFELGFRIIEPGYKGAPLDQAAGPIVVFPRHPRDRCASMLRWKLAHGGDARELVTRNGTDPDTMLHTLLESEPYIPGMLRWAQIWCGPHDGIRVDFESLTASRDAAIELLGQVAAHFGLPADTRRDRRLVGKHLFRSPTYTGQLSRWQDWFGPQSTAFWRAEGGLELEQIMGYADAEPGL